MKNVLKLLVWTMLCSCNMSDYYYELPFGGYEVQLEGGSQNSLMKNHKMIIDSGLVECKYNDDYMFVSVDTTNSMTPKKVMKSNLKYFMQNLKTDTIIKAISYEDLKRLIKDKSLDDIDVTK